MKVMALNFTSLSIKLLEDDLEGLLSGWFGYCLLGGVSDFAGC